MAKYIALEKSQDPNTGAIIEEGTIIDYDGEVGANFAPYKEHGVTEKKPKGAKPDEEALG